MTMVDVAFALDGGSLPRDHDRVLAEAIERALPWWRSALPAAGVHRLRVSGGAQALLARRTRLVLRVPHERAQDTAAALQGSTLEVGDTPLRVGAGQVRELQPWGTLYAHVVAAGDGDETDFLRTVEAELQALGVAARTICGRAQRVDAGALHGYSLMLDGLSAEDALRVLDAGVGAHRRLGCGLFVPHKSAAAVGAPA